MRPPRPARIVTAAGAAIGLALLGFAGAPPAAASTGVCVGGAGCFSTVQSAVDAAHAGATLTIGPGTFQGGVLIRKALTIVGAGSGRTVLRGGDSVVKVSPTSGPLFSVVLSDLTLTGGVARGGTEDTFVAMGGGLHVDGRDDGGAGPAVTIRRVIVTGNRAEPATTTPSGGALCTGGVECPFALAGGGGVSSFGPLTIDHSVITDNAATGIASDAEGGGVIAARGALRILDSTISGNRAEPRSIGRYAEGGGIYTVDGDADHPTIPLTISGSTITGNSSILRTSWPLHPTSDSDDLIDMQANGGGVHINAGYTATIDRTVIDHNAIVADDPAGEPAAYDSGLIEAHAGFLTMTRSSVSHNSSSVVSATADDVGPNGTALEVDGTATIADTAIAGNTATDRGVAGSAVNSNGLAVLPLDGSAGVATLTRVTIVGNTVSATSSTGSATILGAGVLNNGTLSMRDSTVSCNRGAAVSSDATAQGGGIWNGSYITGPGELTLKRSAVTGNMVTAKGGTAQGGGIYSDAGDGTMLSLNATIVKANAPDQVYDASTAALQTKAKLASPRALPSRSR